MITGILLIGQMVLVAMSLVLLVGEMVTGGIDDPLYLVTAILALWAVQHSLAQLVE